MKETCYVRFFTNYYNIFLVSADVQAWSEIFFCWNDLTVVLDLAAKLRWDCPRAAGPKRCCSRCSRSWSGGILGMLNGSRKGQQRPIILEVVSRTTGSVVRNEEIIQGSFRCREFLLVKQISCWVCPGKEFYVWVCIFSRLFGLG